MSEWINYSLTFRGTDMDFLEDLLPWSDKLPEECRKKI